MRYKLLNKHGNELKGVTIDQSAKKDFKKMMGWTEYQWKAHTEEVEK